MTMATTLNPRVRCIRAIKAAERALGMDDSAHRQLVRELAGQHSMTKCDLGQLRAIRDHLNAKTGGFVGKPTKWRPDCGAMIGKIEALLADMRLPWKYARSILKRVSADKLRGEPGTDRLEWAQPAHLQKVIAALTYEQEKRWLESQVDELLAEQGLTRADLPALCAEAGIEWRKDWPRRRDVATRYKSMLIAHRDRTEAAHD